MVSGGGGDRDESQFYGPYNAPLNHFFPVSKGFMVVSQYKLQEESKSVDYATTFLVSHNEHPIFYLEVKASDHMNYISTTGEADKQMRERFRKVFDEV